MTKAEKMQNTIKTYMQKLHISEEEARQLYEDDNSNEILPEVKILEDKGKTNGTKRRYEQSDKPRKASTRERQVDVTKLQLITAAQELLTNIGATISEIKSETEIVFTFENSEYSFKLIKHRQK